MDVNRVIVHVDRVVLRGIDATHASEWEQHTREALQRRFSDTVFIRTLVVAESLPRLGMTMSYGQLSSAERSR